VVNLGSLNAELARGADQHAAYNAAKAALVVWTRSLARSEGRHGLRVNLVAPGIIDTGQLAAGSAAAWARRIPLGRVGRPEDVAEAVAFLASERAAYISGTVLTVAGGLWA
jgi:3-oxoacyl-[acyl-carrier protein] reductase